MNISKNIQRQSIITCPNCGAETEETMDTDACRIRWNCPSCDHELHPKEGDCCVYCSYGTNPCPPVQKGEMCG